MNYIEMTINTEISGIELVILALMKIGITDYVINDPRDISELQNKKHPYDWDYLDEKVIAQGFEQPKIIIYAGENEVGKIKVFKVEQAMIGLERELNSGIFGENINCGSLDVTKKVVKDEDWTDNWKKYFKPMKISGKIVVKPTWCNYENKEGDVIIELDPGMAFGTGAHETTSLCVKLMEKYIKNGDKILDIGCGSGILSISAALLGASKVLGLDIDQEAIRVSNDNVQLNKVGELVKIQHSNLVNGIDYKANLVMANLIDGLIKILNKEVTKNLLPGGIYISSGILIEKKASVKADIENCGFKILEIREDGEWCAIASSI